MSINRLGPDEQPSCGNPSTSKPAPSFNKGKKIVGNKPHGDPNRCYWCGGVGHRSIPNNMFKNLYLGNTEGGDKRDEESDQKENDEYDEDIYIPGTPPSDEERVVEDKHVAYLGQSIVSPYFHVSPLGVVRCGLAQSKLEDGWRTTIFSSFAKCGDKNCQITIDNGSYTNVVSIDTIKRLGLSPISHPQPIE